MSKTSRPVLIISAIITALLMLANADDNDVKYVPDAIPVWEHLKEIITSIQCHCRIGITLTQIKIKPLFADFRKDKITPSASASDLNTGDVKNQWEKKVGHRVHGYYTVREPDGSLRIVHYTADDDHGFNAVVKHEGPSYHPPARAKKQKEDTKSVHIEQEDFKVTPYELVSDERHQHFVKYETMHLDGALGAFVEPQIETGFQPVIKIRGGNKHTLASNKKLPQPPKPAQAPQSSATTTTMRTPPGRKETLAHLASPKRLPVMYHKQVRVPYKKKHIAYIPDDY